jgi:hypothetical protein
LAATKDHLRTIAPSVKCVIFETQPFDMELLKHAGSRGKVRREPDQAEVQRNYENLQRVFYYQTLGAFVAMSKPDIPLHYHLPSLVTPLCEENERRWLLMVLPFDNQAPKMSLTNLFSFVYDDVYGSSFEAPGEARIPGYGEYLQELTHRMLSRNTGCQLGTISRRELPPEVHSLTETRRREGLIGSDSE